MLDGDEFVAFTFTGDFQHDTDARGVELIVVGLERFGFDRCELGGLEALGKRASFWFVWSLFE